MPEAAVAAAGPVRSSLLLAPEVADGARTRDGERARARRALRRCSRVIGMLFWVFIYTLLYKLLVYFRGVPDLGPFLAGKLLGMILIGFFSILLLSNVITALSSFFLARDLDLLVARAGGLAQAVRREAARDGRQLELDGGAAGGADVRRVRRRRITAGRSSRCS